MSTLDVYVLTFNCARNLIKPDVFGPRILNATSTSPDLLILCIQELAPVANAFLGGSFLATYFNAFRAAVKLAGGDYVNVIARNVGLTAIMIFAREEVAPNIRWMQTAGVGVGVSEMGNKGAVGVRLGYGSGDDETRITFVSAHLAPAEDGLDRRNEDYLNIAQKLVFTSGNTKVTVDEPNEDAPLLQDAHPGQGDVCMYDSTSHLLFAGDLNYRTSLLKPSPDDVRSYPQPVKETADPLHFSHLLPEDQLSEQVKQGKTLHGLHEAAIDFPPTYKYNSDADVTLDSDGSWNWASHRWPSWCDRALFSPSGIKVKAYTALPLFRTSDHRPVALSVSVPLGGLTEVYRGSSVPDTIAGEWKAKRDAARRKEIAFGFLAYFTWTYEGEGLLLASVIGAAGGWLIIRSMLAS